ncbi:16S rRNA (uracil(1498)-N(3))-methyltransferase [Arthrobacter sp. JSM 101049]|uniref:16S rRNA (uracil(1498)-N(3))-methyltransferase n=1 Tax=Arthrobacter sp. JSM 101049 TaxID=929097 RepID=UPI00356814CF
MSNQAFLLDDGLPAGTAPGDVVVLDGAEGHHAVTVKRVRTGEAIDLLDGRGTRAGCTVQSTGKACLTARVDRITHDPAPALRLVLVQALAKGDRDLQAVEAAVELGVDEVIPWQADRSVVRWPEAKAEKGRAKWAATVRAAVKQSRRTRLPEVHGVLTTGQLAARLDRAAGEGARQLPLILHEQATEPLSAVVRDFLHDGGSGAGTAGQDAGVPAILLIVGPEGGIADPEVERLAAAGARTALLGHHVLRASTAGPAALVLARHLAGLLDA